MLPPGNGTAREAAVFECGHRVLKRLRRPPRFPDSGTERQTSRSPYCASVVPSARMPWPRRSPLPTPQRAGRNHRIRYPAAPARSGAGPGPGNGSRASRIRSWATVSAKSAREPRPRSRIRGRFERARWPPSTTRIREFRADAVGRASISESRPQRRQSTRPAPPRRGRSSRKKPATNDLGLDGVQREAVQPNLHARSHDSDSRTPRATASRIPFTKDGEGSLPKRRARSTASFKTTWTGVVVWASS